ncbi:MAG: inositol oxygenase family protein [Planctomycetaceae bacterium]
MSTDSLGTSQTSNRPASGSRRAFLAGTLAGAAGVSSAWAVRRQLRLNAAQRLAMGSEGLLAGAPVVDEAEVKRLFGERQRGILDRHAQQTRETVAGLKARYEHPVMGRLDVWEQVLRLGQCIDVTDGRLGAISQLMHVLQAYAAMRRHRIEDPDLLLIALIHDLGKVFLLTGEVPENVLGRSGRLSDVASEAGLDGLVYQFGHGELIYSRIKDHVPEHIAWTVRYHNIDVTDAAPYMNQRDRVFAEKYLKVFRTFDAGSKSVMWVPTVDLAECEALVRQYFPRPILF